VIGCAAGSDEVNAFALGDSTFKGPKLYL